MAGNVSAKDKAPLVLEPTSQWHLNYADDACRLVRIFGEGENKSVFLIERYEPGDSFFMIVAGEPLKASRYADTFFRFGPNGHEDDAPTTSGEFGEYSPALMTGGMFLVTPPGFTDRDERENNDNLEEEAAVSWLEVRRGRRQPVRFELGSMKQPMALMRQCTDELLTHWGIDLEAHRSLTKRAEPKTNPGNWVRSSDYPSDLMLKGGQGIVQFRLSVGADGRPTQCHIQSSTRPEGFDKVVCNALMRRARFEPALDAQGQPIASYWRSTVRFMIP